MKGIHITYTGILLFLLALGLSAPSSTPATAQLLPALSKIDTRVLQAVANGQPASVLLFLREQADLSGAGRLAGKQAKSRFVFQALTAIAARTQAPLLATLDRMGLRSTPYYVVNAIAVDGATRAQLEQLAARPEVALVDPDFAERIDLSRPSLPPDDGLRAAGTTEWGVEKINAPEVWALGYRGRGIVYANADTGVKWNHPALKQHYRGWSAAGVNHNYNWWDAVHRDVSGDGANPCGFNSRVPCDDYGHGTHTLGTGIGNDGLGNRIGVAPGARWIGCRNMESGYGRPSQYIECFQFFLAPWDLQKRNANPDLGADVISNSWTCTLGAPPAGENCTTESLRTTVRNIRAAGIFVAAAAGNSGSACATVAEPPGIYHLATTVGATDIADNLAGFSSRGPVTSDGSGRLKPDLSAPGVNVRSAYPPNGYATMSGTSMATPHVAGAVALLWDARPSLRGNVAATERALFEGAWRGVMASGSCGGTDSATIPNNLFGYGRLDVLAALQSVP